MAEGRLAPLPGGKIKLHAEHFRKVVRRIECIKPLAGTGIQVKQTEDGIEISSNNPVSSPGIPANFRVIELTVCRNGAPDVILVYGPADPEADG
jgi:hypothetical protein